MGREPAFPRNPTPPRGGLPGPSASWPPHLLLGAGRAGRGGFPAQQASLAAQRASFPRPLGSRLPGDLPGLWCFLRVCSEKEGPWGEGLSSVRLWMPRFALGWGALISQGRLFQAPACCDVFLRGPLPSASLGPICWVPGGTQACLAGVAVGSLSFRRESSQERGGLPSTPVR